MSDIVDRCRAASHDDRLSTGMLYREAADEIEKLSALLETANTYGANENAARIAAEADRDRLRAVSDVLFDARIPLVEEVDRLRAEVAAKEDRLKWFENAGGVALTARFYQVEAERDRLRAERQGDIDANRGHPDWETASHKDVLDALRFQGAITKSLIEETEGLRAEVQNLKNKLKASGRTKLREERDRLRAEISAWELKNAHNVYLADKELSAMTAGRDRLQELLRSLRSVVMEDYRHLIDAALKDGS